MYKKINIINNLFSICLQFFLFYAINIELCFILRPNEINLYAPISLIIFISLGYFVKKYINNIFLIIICYLSFIIPILFFNIGMVQKVILIMSIIFMIYFALTYFLNKKLQQILFTPNLYSEIIFLTVYLHTRSTNEKLGNIILFIGLAFILFYILYYYSRNIIRFFHNNSHLKNLPIKEIVTHNIIMLLLLFVVFFIVIILSFYFNLDSVFLAILQGIWSAIAFILRKIIYLITGTSQELPEFTPTEDTPITSYDFKTPKEDFAVSQRIYKFFTFVIFAAICIFIIYLIYNFFKNNFKKNKLQTDNIEFINPKNKSKNNSNKLTSYFFDTLNIKGNNNIKIRKIYKNKLKKHKNLTKKVLTPRELYNKIYIENEDMKKLTHLYEKARYSNTICSNDDVKKAKNIN